MHLENFFHGQAGKYIMSVLLGFGLATLFRQICTGKDCLKFYAPPLEEIDDQIYKFDDKCFNLQKAAVNCDTKKEILPFE
jgi:hypothetical protein